MQQAGRQDRLVAERHFVFPVVVVEPRLGQRRPADALVRVLPVEMREADRQRVALALLVAPRAAEQQAAVRRRDVLLVDAARNRRVHDRLVRLAVDRFRQQEVRLRRARHRAAKGPLDDPPLLGCLGLGERVFRVEVGVAKAKIEGAVVVLPARLGDDLDPTAARPHELG